MAWLIALGMLPAFWLGRVFGKADAREAKNELWRSERGRLEAETRYLEYLRRDIALALLDDDPKVLVDAHATVEDFTRAMRDGDTDRLEAERKVLSLKYPKYDDFDFFTLRHFVPVEPKNFEQREAVERYVDIGKFLVILASDHGTLKFQKDEHLDRDRQVLERMIQRLEDRRLVELTDEAIGRFYVWRRMEGEGAFEDARFRVEMMAFDYSPEIEYGVTLKEIGKRTIYGHYTFDDRPKTIYSYSLAGDHWEKIRSLSKS